MKNYLLYLIMMTFASFGIISCGNTVETASEEPTETSKVEDTAPPKMKYEIMDFGETKPFPDASIADISYKDGKFEYKIEATDYKLGNQTTAPVADMCANSGKGQHIHFIVNNEPYSAHYEATFEKELPDGEHILTTFLSRSYHESIKTQAASRTAKITIKDNSMTAMNAVTTPMLTYSRPKGTYVGKDTENVMLDFFINNVALGDNFMVEADINGEKHELREWKPYFIIGLPMGENTITLTLKDADGQIVDAPYNPVSRTFTLKADPAEGL